MFFEGLMLNHVQLISQYYVFMVPIFAFLYFPMAVMWCSESLGRQKAPFPLLMWKASKYMGVLALLTGPVLWGKWLGWCRFGCGLGSLLCEMAHP